MWDKAKKGEGAQVGWGRPGLPGANTAEKDRERNGANDRGLLIC